MRSYEIYFSFNRTEIRYYVNVYKQPIHRYAIAKLYFWYEMHVFKVPGFKSFERWDADRKFKKHGFPIRTISDLQGEKRYFLDKQDKEVIATFEVDEVTYIRLGGRPVREKT